MIENQRPAKDRFAFWGAIDQQYLQPRGSNAELEADIREKIAGWANKAAT